MGSILQLARRLAEAKAQLRHTVELSATYPHSYLDLARVAAIEGNYAAAFDDLSRAPELVVAYGSGIRGDALAKFGMYATCKR